MGKPSDRVHGEAEVDSLFAGRKLVITGGTGTFGHAVLKRMLGAGLSEIRVFSRDELKQDQMRRTYGNSLLRFYLGDVRDRASLDTVMHGADFVFHAAALKQVPSCEFFPMEAIRTNALGAENVLNAAIDHGVSRAIVLSTDKAAYPINVMGLTKALMEKLALAKANRAAEMGTVICATRYGNVMASRGSVIPLFLEQITAGKPLTITNPLMTRFLMTIEDAVNLAEFAFRNANPGDLFVQKAPAATIGDLAESIQRVAGRKVGVQTIGVRHGEKLYETLLTSEEMARAEDMGEYFRVRPDQRDLNYTSFFTDGEPKVAELLDYHSHNTRRLGVDDVATLLRDLPEVQDWLSAQ
jgi:UDP-N-acetylglucosamine 4,6-dehydratase/5-epimerase